VDSGFEVTLRGPDGQPQEIRCVAHAACPWRLSIRTARSDDDALIRAMMEAHRAERRDPDRRAGGHVRKPRK
jgi:hypothetical protein